MHSPRTTARTALALAGSGAGQLLGAVFGGVAALRRSKPLHPRGRLVLATLAIEPAEPVTFVPLLDTAAEHPCVVRTSRATGIPAPLPDILGLAIRLTQQGSAGHADILFASTGTGRASRFVLLPRRSLDRGTLTTLLPLRTDAGPLLLSLTPTPGTGDGRAPGGSTFALASAAATGAWTARGTLTLDGPAEEEPDPLIRFDPVTNPAEGLDNYPVVRALREPSYLRARRAWPRPQPAGPPRD